MKLPFILSISIANKIAADNANKAVELSFQGISKLSLVIYIDVVFLGPSNFYL